MTTVCSYLGLFYMYNRKWLSSVVTWCFFTCMTISDYHQQQLGFFFFLSMPLSDVGVRFGAMASENKLEIYPDFPTSRRTDWQQRGTLAKPYGIARQAPNWHFQPFLTTLFIGNCAFWILSFRISLSPILNFFRSVTWEILTQTGINTWDYGVQDGAI